MGFLEAKIGNFLAGIGESGGEVGDWGEKRVEAIEVVFAEFMGGLIGDELISAEGLVVEDLIGDAGSEFLESMIATVDEVLNFLIGENIEVVENFGD